MPHIELSLVIVKEIIEMKVETAFSNQQPTFIEELFFSGSSTPIYCILLDEYQIILDIIKIVHENIGVKHQNIMSMARHDGVVNRTKSS